MADTTASSSGNAHQTETIFKNYKAEEAARYAAYRPAYPPKLIDLVITTHSVSGGQFEHVLDIGCGPGIATRQIASYFQKATGIDASASMIENARLNSCRTASGEQATFDICSAEDIDKHFEPNSIDLITAATAAHWFDMARFYAAASKVLKPSGSIALWSGSRAYADPKTTPNYEAVNKLWDQLEEDIMKPYEIKGNHIVRNLYADLDLPWTIDTSSHSAETISALTMYDKSASMRREFNKDGIPDPHPDFAETNGFLKFTRTPLVAVAKMLDTISPVTRWRQAHKEQLERGEIEDCVDYIMKATKAVIAEATSGEQRDWVDYGTAMVLIIIKRTSS